MDLLPIHRRKGRGRHKGLDPAFFDLLNQETCLFAVLLDAPLDPPPGPSPWADDAGGTPRTRQQRCSPAPTPRRRPPRSPGWSIGGCPLCQGSCRVYAQAEGINGMRYHAYAGERKYMLLQRVQNAAPTFRPDLLRVFCGISPWVCARGGGPGPTPAPRAGDRSASSETSPRIWCTR